MGWAARANPLARRPACFTRKAQLEALAQTIEDEEHLAQVVEKVKMEQRGVVRELLRKMMKPERLG